MGPKSNKAKIKNIEDIRSTMLTGGYYRYDLDYMKMDYNLTVLSLNTIFFDIKNNKDPNGAASHMQWFKQ